MFLDLEAEGAAASCTQAFITGLHLVCSTICIMGTAGAAEIISVVR